VLLSVSTQNDLLFGGTDVVLAQSWRSRCQCVTGFTCQIVLLVILDVMAYFHEIMDGSLYSGVHRTEVIFYSLWTSNAVAEKHKSGARKRHLVTVVVIVFMGVQSTAQYEHYYRNKSGLLLVRKLKSSSQLKYRRTIRPICTHGCVLCAGNYEQSPEVFVLFLIAPIQWKAISSANLHIYQTFKLYDLKLSPRQDSIKSSLWQSAASDEWSCNYLQQSYEKVLVA
jgi:hypothetical protein